MKFHPPHAGVAKRQPGTRFACLALACALVGCSDDSGTDDPVPNDAGLDAEDGNTGDTDGGDDVAPDAEDDADADDPDAGDTDTGGIDAPDADPLNEPFDITSGQATLAVDPEQRTLSLTYDGAPRFALDADAFQLGVVARLDNTRSYGPTGFFAESPATIRPTIERWAVVAGVEAVAPGDDDAWSHALRLTFDDGRTALLTIAPEAGRFAMNLRVEADELDGAVAFVRVRAAVDDSERFYGLGELFDQVEHRGTVRAMQLEGDVLEGANNEAHVPVPFITGTSGWGLFFATYRPGVFDVAAADAERVDVVFGMAEDATAGLEFHVFADAHPLDVTRHYYEVTGYPARPARWALGPWIWRDENESEEQFRSDAATIRELDLAGTGLWIDRPYASAVGAFDWKASQWNDAPDMIDDVRDLGFRVALWNVPYLDESADTTADLVEEAEENGYFPPRSALSLNNWGRPIDLTNPDAYDWWQSLVQLYIDDGIEGFKLDYGEDIILAPLGGRFFWEFFDGSDDRTMHAAYQPLYHRLYAELLPEDGGFLLCRGGTWGDQVHVSVVWPGDLNADFTRHREPVEDGEDRYVSVGGLPAALIAGLSLGPSGFPLYGSDTGGYRHAPPDKETFTRWFQITALSPVMQVGTNTNDVPWEADEDNGFDEEMLGWYRRYARLHLRLWPYVWSHLMDLYATGRAIQRPIGLAYPESGRHPSDQFLLGDALLVAPVVERDARARDVYFPPGVWFDWWTGERIEGPTDAEVDAPLDHLPLYVAEAGLIPMLRDSIDTMAPVANPELVDSYATDAGVLTVRTTASGGSARQLFDGTTLSQTADGERTLAYVSGSEFDSGVRFEVIGSSEPAGVNVDRGAGPEGLERNDALDDWTNTTDGWTWIADRGGTLIVQSPITDVSFTIVDVDE